jgi:hypothetical protein
MTAKLQAADATGIPDCRREATVVSIADRIGAKTTTGRAAKRPHRVFVITLTAARRASGQDAFDLTP